MTAPHSFQNQINYVQEFLHARAIPFEVDHTRWGPVILAEGVRINFNKRTINVYHKKVSSPAGELDWNWTEQLHEPQSPEETKAIDDYLKLVCCAAHYASMARQFTKAPEWIIFTTIFTPDHGNQNNITVQAWVALNHLGAATHMKYLDRHEYVVINKSYHDPESDRVRTHDFNNMTLALGSPVGSSYTDGHAPEAEGNFLNDGPFTFVPAKATIHTSSNYVLPDTEPETWDIWVLVRTHDIKMCVETSK
jgi:hypothetical protein